MGGTLLSLLLLGASIGALGVWAITAALPWQPHRTRERLVPAAAWADLSAVTVLIPARDEVGLITETLRALARQGPGLHVRVIDDESRDATADAVRAAAVELAAPDESGRAAIEIELLTGKPLPAGWSGKLWALQQGFEAGCRNHTLLLDADIALEPRVIPALLEVASQRRAALVSVMARLRCDGAWEKLLVPPFIFFFKLLYPFALAADHRSRVAAAAGGCILIETRALAEVGAFAPLRTELIDDCALARRVKDHGLGLWIGLSDAVVSRRRYDALADFWHMVSRTAFTQLRYSATLLVATTALMAWLFVLPLVAIVTAPLSSAATAGVCAWLAMAAVFLPTVRYYRLSPLWALTLPAAAALMLAMTWTSALNYWGGMRARWKLRAYSAD